ncbi:MULTISPECIES: hypothetical protein [Mycobacterium]|uniref:Uncharacterized protein n=1 Tax=Mycobacterium indicus pranii (strain DSM 45239 / MTCC 9506) TaxID=1232724 RepID=J9WIA3_MYCIP|nr:MULTISPECIES: hypothetical protein [Mycobacterium]AFS16969.1 Hypothetical protein MIP_07399 [Mycobacterium intracellulare subsp. intracellulare MTCC 9506]WSE51775.1 hypothetical protein QGN31_01330 [Mycobacterium sp. 2-64]BCO54490.1 hypothetical protein MINTM003_49310 [Mycobacterium paraintracellulare]BCO91758.1 hypothetical protein MINTM015_50150 [Mycobacterium paraintracellulare]
MRGQGHQIFGDELARFADGLGDARVTAIARRTAAPLRVAVRGRRGVGRRTVARALGRAGSASGIAADLQLTSAAPDPGIDAVVYVVAEVVKPEDAHAIATAGRPVVAVLNKADLSGRRGDGPIAAARARCADLSALIGVPMEPMIGLLALALDELDGPEDNPLWAALHTLATHPGGAACLDGSFAGFLAADGPVPAGVRQRLLDALDLFGTALAVAAIRQGRTPAQVRTLLRRMSGVDAVLTRLGALGAEVRYQRVLAAVAGLEALAAGGGELGDRIGGFLSRDDTVVARMAAAVDLAEAAGLDPGDPEPAGMDRDPAAHLPRAVRWQRYGRASASELHRACGADIARGSLRLWSQACASLPGESW